MKIGQYLCIIFCGITSVLPVAAFDTHRYVVDDARLIIYPVNVSLGLKQKHAALFEIAREISSRNQQEFADFVTICLQELASMYEEQVLQTQAGEERKNNQAAVEWQVETMALANELYRTAESINPAMELAVDRDDTGELMITVGNEIHILSNPLINRPYVLDERIIKRVCQKWYCSTELISRQELFNKRTIIIKANWIIEHGQKPAYSTSNGLHFVFNNLERRSEKQIGSLKLIREIRLITDSLKEAVDKGVLLDWSSMLIKQYRDSYDYRIQLNRFSDSLYLHLPELHHVNGWKEKLLPWIRGQVTGEPVDHYINGDEVLAYVLG